MKKYRINIIGCIIILFISMCYTNVNAGRWSTGIIGSADGAWSGSGDWGNLPFYTISNTAGMRVSVLRKIGNDYKVIMSQDYYQAGFNTKADHDKYGWTTEKEVGYFGSKYEIVYERKGNALWKRKNWVRNRGTDRSYEYSLLKGTEDYSPITKLKEFLGYSIENIETFVLGEGNKAGEVILKKKKETIKIQGLHLEKKLGKDFFDELKCEASELYILLEPMIALGIGNGRGEYWGTSTEIATLSPGAPYHSSSTIGNLAVTTDDTLKPKSGSLAGQEIELPFKKASGSRASSWSDISKRPSKKTKKNPKRLAKGYGLQIVWAGNLGENCDKCYSPTIDAKELTKPVCKTGGQSLSVYQKMVEDNQKCSQLTPEQKQENSAAGVREEKIAGNKENNCTIYCKESITVNYPGKLNNKIEFGLGLKDKNVIWPDDKTYKMSLVGKKTCKFVVHGNMTNLSKCDIEITDKRAQKYYEDFDTLLTLDYTDPVYGDGQGNINLNVTSNSKATCTGSCEKIRGTLTKERIEGREFTITRVKTLGLDPKTSYSVFNHRSSRYEKLGEKTVGDGYTNFQRGQLAISKESLEKDTEYKKNIKISTLGDFIRNGKVNGTSEVIPAYSCGYQVSAGNDCSSCYDSEGKKHSICCLASNSAEAMDKYCPNGVMDENAMKKDQIDPEKVKQDKACSCDGKANYSGDYDMTDCLQKQMKAGKNYKEAYAACLNTEPFKTYCCVNCAKVYYCPPPLTSTQIPASCVEEYGLDYCKRAYCTVCQNDRSQDNNMRECMLSGLDENDCKIKYCHSYCILKDGTKKDISSCMADKKDYNLCSIEAGCPTSITCGDLGVTNGTKNIDITFCLESFSAQQCKDTYCSNRNVCPSNSDHPERVIGPEDISKYGSLDNAIKALCNDCPNCVKVMFCTDRNHKQINMTTCYNKKLINGMDEAVAKKECMQEYCPSDGDMFLYRTVDLKSPFTGSSLNGGKMTSRLPGENWGDKTSNNTNSLAYKYIVKDADTLYRQTDPMYTIDLGASTIRSIRQYNNDHEYNDYRMNCDRNGNNCISKFLKENTVSMDISGKCKVTTSGELQRCMK